MSRQPESSVGDSQRWGCGTLRDGVEHVMKDVNGVPVVDTDDDHDEEEALVLAQIKERTSNC